MPVLPHPQTVLTKQQLTKLLERLSPLESTYSWMGNTVHVYLAKQVHAEKPVTDHAHRLLLEARKSYQERFGEDIQLYNQYDNKSEIVLATVKDSSGSLRLFSMRCISAEGHPSLTEDLLLCGLKKGSSSVPLYQAFESRGVTSDRIYTLSRFCSTPAYGTFPQNSKVSCLAFVAMVLYFLKRFPDKVITTLFHEKLRRESLSAHGNTLAFPYAYEYFGCSPEQIGLLREGYGQYVYRYPSYFLSLPSLHAILQKLIHQQQLPSTWISVLDDPKQLATYLTTPGPIVDGKLTTEELRHILSGTVPDGPTLYIGGSQTWQENVERFMIETGCKEL